MIPDDLKLFESSNEEFVKNTKKDFAAWVEILNAWDGLNKGHTMIVEYLKSNFALEEKWAYAVSVRYQKEAYLKKI